MAQFLGQVITGISLGGSDRKRNQMGKLKKSWHERREELRQALYRMDGALSRYKQTSEIAEIGIIAMELRGLLCAEALFLSLSNEKGVRLEVCTYQPPFLTDQLSGELKKGLSFAFSGDCVSLVCEKPWTNRVTVNEWLDMPVAEIQGNRVTPKNLINEVANNLGPAHYSADISSRMTEMKTINIGGVPSYFRTLLKFAEVLLTLGKRFLQMY